MTYTLRNLVGIARVYAGRSAPEALLFTHSHWPRWLRTVYVTCIGYHLAHALEFAVTALCYLTLWPPTLEAARSGYQWRWVAQVFLFNYACAAAIFGFWHWLLYASPAKAPMRQYKWNKVEQYEDTAGWLLSSASLEREVAYTAVGITISSGYQVWYMYLLASGTMPYIPDFFGPALPWNLACLWIGGLWRLFHFYFAHRVMHPWWRLSNGLAQGDVGAFLYRWCHSVHHASHNPGPFSGLSMHPVEHLIYYSCVLLALAVPTHPSVFLYMKFHADFAPVGGHDGFDKPGGGSDYHYLHHSKFECNYGVPVVPLDAWLGTFVDPAVVREKGYALAKKAAWGLPQRGDDD